MRTKHRATTRYRYGKYRGKHIPHEEIQRRIAQSYGFKFTLPEAPEQQEQIETITEYKYCCVISFILGSSVRVCVG